uniref:Reverse transcriptase Ty1/copia-type domain-containing protein n=1 Tax=Peronospora matthiolae TaxID=2874970 RepID=A0AAV1U4F3_9STRA
MQMMTIAKVFHAVRRGPREPVAAVTLFQSFVVSALGAGAEQYTNLPDPKTYKASRALPDAHLSAQAMDDKIALLEKNNTWQVIKREKHMHVIRNKWVFEKKMNGSGSIERYKASLVAEGDDQVLGRDYNLAFTAVLDLTGGKIILAVARLWNVRATL